MAGKSYRKGVSLAEAVEQFGDEQAVERMFIRLRWPDGMCCPRCGSIDVVPRPNRRPLPFRCRDCRRDFSVKTGTVMHGSNLPLGTWAMAAYLLNTSLKGVSSMKLARDLGVTQRTAWHLAHRIRRAMETSGGLFGGPTEVDETYVGGRFANRPLRKRTGKPRGTEDRVAVVGMLDRSSNQIRAEPIESTSWWDLQRFIEQTAQPDATVYSDDFAPYRKLTQPHRTVRHTVSQYVDGQVHTNGIESFWATLKRGYHGVYHHMSAKHLHRYVNEFAGRHNSRRLDTIHQVHTVIRGMDGKRLRLRDLMGRGHG